MKILIVDDEPLVQAGIKSMLNWSDNDCTIVGTASNGEMAYKMILEHEPDLVITDIKMPVMSGLELIQKCYEENRELPLFILLTSYEELSFYKEAMKYHVLEYLIKLELTPDTLLAAINHAKKKLPTKSSEVSAHDTFDAMRERFLAKLIMNMLDNNDDIAESIKYYHLDFSSSTYMASYLQIKNIKEGTSPESQSALYTSSLQMITQLIEKYIKCDVISLDIRNFCMIFHLDGSTQDSHKQISDALTHVSDMLYNYYNVRIIGGIGSPVHSPEHLSDSYLDAKRVAPKADPDSPFIFYEGSENQNLNKNVFNISLFKNDLQKAFSEYDSETLQKIVASVSEIFEESPSHYLQAVDIASSILYMAISFLHNGESVVSEIFADNPAGFRSLYESNTTYDVLSWLNNLCAGLCDYFDSQNGDFKSNVVTNVKKYIRDNMTKRLSLNEVASEFNISPSYLSMLFSKYNDIGFSDYINQCKIDAAKKMLIEGELKIYEIADELSFESTSYFSRVFKKMTGLSPREYLNQISPQTDQV